MLRMTRMTSASTEVGDDDADDGPVDLVFGDEIDFGLRTQPRHDAGLGELVGCVHVRGNAMPHPAYLDFIRPCPAHVLS